MRRIDNTWQHVERITTTHASTDTNFLSQTLYANISIHNHILDFLQNILAQTNLWLFLGDC